jgi:hypothetical protein
MGEINIRKRLHDLTIKKLTKLYHELPKGNGQRLIVDLCCFRLTGKYIFEHNKRIQYPLQHNKRIQYPLQQKKRISKLAENLQNSFTWADTPEGYTYWETVYENLLKKVE